MREILFRAKRVDTGEWVYGFFWKDIWGDGESCYILCDCVDYPVDPSTVSQYTGFLDAEGERIFEGDVVRLVKPGVSRPAVFVASFRELYRMVHLGWITEETRLEIVNTCEASEGGECS